MAPAGFVLCGVVGAALVDLRRGVAGAKRFLLRGAPAWGVSLALAYLAVYGPASRNPYLQRYWRSAMLSPGEAFPDRLWSLLNESLWGLALGYPGPPGRDLPNTAFLVVAVLLLVLLVAGAGWLRARFGWSVAALVAGPPLAAVLASVLGLYPVGLRLGVFAMPLVQLLLLSGLGRIVRRLPEPRARRALVMAGSALALPLFAISLLQVRQAGGSEDVRALVEELSRHRQHEPVYVFAGSIPPWVFYSTDWRAPDRRRLAFVSQAAGSGGAAFENAPSRGLVAPGEGEGLQYGADAGLELYGLATGIEWTPNLGPLKHTPDPGWAESEAGRLVGLGAPAVWVLLSHMVGTEGQLRQELERRGMCPTHARELDNAVLIRYLFRPSGAAASCPV
jgi:hypothetical protein